MPLLSAILGYRDKGPMLLLILYGHMSVILLYGENVIEMCKI
jgi:hypothetical protein